MFRSLIATVALLVAACEAAPIAVTPAAAPPPMADPFATPEWAARAPGAEDIMRVYPTKALREAVEGIAYLNCTVTGSYYLDCVEGTETPPGYGFGPAALEISRLFMVRKNYPGVEPGTEFRLPVRFKAE